MHDGHEHAQHEAADCHSSAGRREDRQGQVVEAEVLERSRHKEKDKERPIDALRRTRFTSMFLQRKLFLVERCALGKENMARACSAPKATPRLPLDVSVSSVAIAFHLA